MQSELKALSVAQLKFLATEGKEGRPHGLVRRNLISYRWGRDPSFGYVFSPKVTAAALLALAEQVQR